MNIHGLSYGNYVHTPEGIKLITGVVESKIGFIIHWGEEKYCRAIHCKPVELTPEILEACGFTNPKSMRSSLFVDKNDFICIDIIKGVLYLNAIPTKFPPPKYLHQLQNLHLSLTDTTLAVNLKEAQEG